MHIGLAFWSTAIAETEQQEYIEALVSSMAAIAPQHTFTIITDAFVPVLPASTNLLQVPLTASYFGLRRWYGKTLPALVKREGLDALITINGNWVNTSVPQLPILRSPQAALKTCNTWLSFLYKSYLAKRLQNATAVGVITSLQGPELKKLYGLKESQLLAVGYAIPVAYQPMDDWQNREAFLQKQTGGKEYFLYTGRFEEAPFLHLLKAFSLFKKRQKSNMQLLVPGQINLHKKLQEKLDTYKYRQDVQLLNGFDKNLWPQLMACAYAVLFTHESTNTAQPVAAAMQCNIPVIASETNEAAKEVVGAAALYADATVENLAEQMKLVYKDEILRQNLVFNAQQQALLVNERQAVQNIFPHLKIND